MTTKTSFSSILSIKIKHFIEIINFQTIAMGVGETARMISTRNFNNRKTQTIIKEFFEKGENDEYKKNNVSNELDFIRNEYF